MFSVIFNYDEHKRREEKIEFILCSTKISVQKVGKWNILIINYTEDNQLNLLL
jgi:hypothetical protein